MSNYSPIPTLLYPRKFSKQKTRGQLDASIKPSSGTVKLTSQQKWVTVCSAISWQNNHILWLINQQIKQIKGNEMKASSDSFPAYIQTHVRSLSGALEKANLFNYMAIEFNILPLEIK